MLYYVYVMVIYDSVRVKNMLNILYGDVFPTIIKT